MAVLEWNGGRKIIETPHSLSIRGIFILKEIDLQCGEITLGDKDGHWVIVDLDDEARRQVKKLELREDERIFCEIYSREVSVHEACSVVDPDVVHKVGVMIESLIGRGGKITARYDIRGNIQLISPRVSNKASGIKWIKNPLRDVPAPEYMTLCNLDTVLHRKPYLRSHLDLEGYKIQHNQTGSLFTNTYKGGNLACFWEMRDVAQGELLASRRVFTKNLLLVDTTFGDFLRHCISSDVDVAWVYVMDDTYALLRRGMVCHNDNYFQA